MKKRIQLSMLYAPLLCLSLTIALFSTSTFGDEGDKIFDFHLQEQSLEDALTELSEQAEISILFLSNIVTGYQVPALNAKLTLKGALIKLLSNTNLTFRISQNKVLVFVKEKEVVKTKPLAKKQQTEIVDKAFLTEVIVVGETRHQTDCCRYSPSTATKTFVPTIEVPQSLEGIGWDAFHDRGDATLTEAFRDFSSINVINKVGDLNIRGFVLKDRSIMKDGLPVVSHGIVSPLLQSYEGIEVSKGVNSALYGHGVPGAAINLITKKPKAKSFSHFSTSYGNQDGFIALDHNSHPWSNDKLWQRINLAVRQERGDGQSNDETIYYLFTPAVQYHFDDDSTLDAVLEFNQQHVYGNRGIRPVEHAVDGSSFAIFYGPDSEISGIKDFYPISSLDYDDPQKATIIDLRTTFETMLQNDWHMSFQTYIGQFDADKKYFSDQNWLANVVYDTQEFAHLPNGLVVPSRSGIAALTGGILNASLFNNNPKLNFEEVVGHSITDIFTAGVVDFPYWSDGRVHFYSQRFNEKINSDQFNLEFNFNREIEIFNRLHNLLIGLSYQRHAEEDIVDSFFNTELYDLGTGIIGDRNVTGPAVRTLGYALRRYSQVTAYFPTGPQLQPGIVLPDTIATAAGLDPLATYGYDSQFMILSRDITTAVWGFYLQDQINFNEQWKLRLASGVYRFNSERTNVALNPWGLVTGDRLPLGNHSDIDETFLSPSVGLVYLPQPDLSFFISYGKQFDIIDAVDSGRNGFGPEKTIGYEVGTKWWLLEENDLNLNLSFFQLTVDNWMLTDPDNTLFFSQSGEFRTTGAELSVRGFITPHWKISAAHSKTHPSVLVDNGYADREQIIIYATSAIPEQTSNLFLQYYWTPFGKTGWSVGAGASYMSSRNNNYNGLIIPLDSYTLYDMNVIYNDEEFRFSFHIDNVTDEDWLLSGSATPVTFLNTKNLFQGYGRRCRLTSEFFF